MPFVLCRFIGNASFLSSLMFSGWCFVALYLNEDVDYDESDVSLLSYFTSGITGDSCITSNFPFLRASFFTLFSFLFFKFFFITISYVFPFQIFSFLFFSTRVFSMFLLQYFMQYFLVGQLYVTPASSCFDYSTNFRSPSLHSTFQIYLESSPSIVIRKPIFRSCF